MYFPDAPKKIAVYLCALIALTIIAVTSFGFIGRSNFYLPPVEINPESSSNGQHKKPPIPILFSEESMQWGLTTAHRQSSKKLTDIREITGSGACVIDADGDGWEDILIVGGSGEHRFYGRQAWWGKPHAGNSLWRNIDGNHFENITDSAAIPTATWPMGCAVADFDNDGYDEIFMNNIGEPNKLFKILDNGVLEQLPLDIGLEPDGYGTGAAVADIDNDGVLELLVSHGESFDQPLSLYKAKVNPKNKYLRIKPLNKYGAPARGATVTLISNLRKHSKTIDSGSGYLCQMEPVAHFGIRKNEKNIKVQVKWTNGKTEIISVKKLNKTITLNQSN